VNSAVAVIRDVAPRATEAAWTARGLTPAESRIAERLAAGETPGEICSRLGITMNTLKTHRLRVYAKLEIDTQAKLAEHLLVVPANGARNAPRVECRVHPRLVEQPLDSEEGDPAQSRRLVGTPSSQREGDSQPIRLRTSRRELALTP
jgi:DNA-binding CsgD family transcriptional regulator